MKTLSLDTLLADLEKTAGIEKAASAAPEVKPAVSAELAGILEKKAAEDVTAAAFAAGEALAKELLTKLAADNEIQIDNATIVAQDDKKILPNETGGTINAPLEGTVRNAIALGAKSDDIVDTELDKQAQIKSENEKMARNIMQKIAQLVGEEVTSPAAGVNVEGAVAPNMIQEANAVMTAQDDSKVQPLPGADGTLNNILEAVVARAQEQGAVSDDLVNGDTPASSAETFDGDSSASVAQEADEQEKAAAVAALVEAGCDFASAVDLVKQAEEMIQTEADQQEKIAAVNTLVGAGYDFESAVAMVKQAEIELAAEANPELEKAAAVQAVMGEGYSFEEAVELVKQASVASKNPKKDSLARAHEKKAAFDALIEAGIDFDQAAAMVKQAEIDVYGSEE